MKRFFILSLFFIFIFDCSSFTYSQGNNRDGSLDTSNTEDVVKVKMLALEELIEYEILISEFYNGDYHTTLKKAIEVTSQAGELIEKGKYDRAIRRIEIAVDLANKVFNLSNKESSNLEIKVKNRMQQLERLFEYSNKLYFNNDFTDFSLKLKELFQQAKVSYGNARSETKNKQYISAQDSISFAMDCLMSAMKYSADELLPVVKGIIREKIADVDELIENDMDSILQSGSVEIQWYFNQGLKYRDLAEKDMQKSIFRSYEAIELSRGYCNIALKKVHYEKDDSVFVAISRFEQNRIEKLELKNQKEYDFFKTFEKLCDVRNRLSYQDSLVKKVISAVNGSKDYSLKTRLKRLLDIRKSIEVSLFLEDNNSINTFQYVVAKLSYKLLEFSKLKSAKSGNSN